MIILVSHNSELFKKVCNKVILIEGRKLIYEGTDEPIDGVAKKISQTVDNIHQACESLAKGSGTLGALLVDSSLYDNLVEVTDGAKRSFILRQAIRSSLDDDDS